MNELRTELQEEKVKNQVLKNKYNVLRRSYDQVTV